MSAVDFSDDLSAPVSPNSTGLSVRFKIKQVRDQEKTLAEGRPIHVPTEFIEIHVLGDRTNIIDRPVEPYDRLRFQKQYKAFKEAGDKDNVMGQSLKDWPILDESLAEDWIALGVRTIEQLAEVPEQNLARMGAMARQYQRKAQTYLEASKQEAPLHFMQAELDKKDAQIEQLRQEFQAAMAQMRGEMPTPPVSGAVPMPTAESAKFPTAEPKGVLIRKKA